MTKRALVSVYEKRGIVDFSHFLAEKGYALLATGGTFTILKDAGLPVTEVSQYTGTKEILSGRVKTLHPKIHAGLLGQRDNNNHLDIMKKMDIDPIDVLVVNLYPFFKKSDEHLPMDTLIEFIDIGGVAMMRSAAKNHKHVSVIVHPDDYNNLMQEWEVGDGLSQSTRRKLAAKVFALTSAYDAAIAESLHVTNDTPQWLTSSYVKSKNLRYGENPHQNAAWYIPSTRTAFGALSDMVQHQGKELSFNNIRDIDGAWRVVSEFNTLACVVLKHATPCAVALGETTLAAWEQARDADPVSVFGGIVAFNKVVDERTAKSLTKIFLEVIAAPDYTKEALTVLKKKKNLRVLSILRISSDRWEALPVDGGICLQEVDREFISEDCWSVPTQQKPTEKQIKNMQFAWKIVKHVKSNGIVLASNLQTTGIGSGQANRVEAVRIAMEGRDVRNSVMASDAFFPFDDAVKLSSTAGISAIIQPGGSLRDTDSIRACNDAGIPMVFTGRRHFRH